MNEIELNEINYDTFPVIDPNDNLVTGLTNGDFTKHLYNPNGTEVSGTITVTITELGNGNYRTSFTPNMEGSWVVVVYNATYFSTGKRNSYVCMTRTSDIDDILEDSNAIQVKLPATYIMGSSDDTNKDDEIDSINSSVDTMEADLKTHIDTVEADLKTYMDTIETNMPDTIWDEVLTGVTHNDPSSSGRRLRELGDAISGSVNDAGASTTEFITNLTENRDDFYNDQYIRFTSGNLEGHVRIVSDYDGNTKTITVPEPMVEVPDNGIDFIIIPVHIHPIDQVADAVWDEDISTHSLPNSASIGLRGTAYSIGTITYDSVGGTSGTGYPVGSSYVPSDNLTDTILIMTYGKVNDLVIKSNLTIGATHDVSNFVIRTIGIMGTDVVLISGCTADQTSFRNVNLSGTITNGDKILIYDSSIGNLANFTGIMSNVSFSQSSEITIGYWAEILQGTCGGDPTNEVEINIGTASLNMSHWTGNLKLTGKTGTDRTVINCDSGNIIIDSTCTAGTIQILGNGVIEADNSGAGCTVDLDGFSSIEGLAGAVWEESMSEHNAGGTFGEGINTIDTNVSYILVDTDTMEADINAHTTSETSPLATEVNVTNSRTAVLGAISDSETNIRGGSDTLDNLSLQMDNLATDISVVNVDINELTPFIENILGLCQHNIKINSISRNEANRATSMQLTIYTDNTLTTPITSYTATSTYDMDGNLTSNEVKEN